jgi:hypothetical protein
MNKVDELVQLFQTGKGKVHLSSHRLIVRGKKLPETPMSLAIETSDGDAHLVLDAVLSEMSKAAQGRFKAAFMSKRRSGVEIHAKTVSGLSISFSFFRGRPVANPSRTEIPRNSVHLKFRIEDVEIHNGSALISGHHTVNEIDNSTEHDFETHAAIHNVRFDVCNAYSSQEKSHPFHTNPAKKCTQSMCCLTGEIEKAKYCIEQHGGTLFFSLKGKLSEQIKDPETTLDAIVKATGFVFGFEPWPFYQITKLQGKITRHTLRIPSDVQSEWRGPLPTGAGGSDVAYYTKMIACLSSLLRNENEEAAFLNKLIWIARQPCRAHVPMQVRLLATCSALEGLRKPYSRVKLPQEYEDKKDEWRFRCMFDQANIPWRQIGEPIFKTWKAYRDPLSHGFLPTHNQVSLNDYDDMLDSLIQLNHGLQLYILRKAGYEGKARYFSRVKVAKILELKDAQKVNLPKAIRPFLYESP